MSSRILRRYQEDEKEKIDVEISDVDESLSPSEETVKHRDLRVNPFEVLHVPSDCESGAKTEEDNEKSCESKDVRRKKKKKKKKKVNKSNHQMVREKSDCEDEYEDDLLKIDEYTTEFQTVSTTSDAVNIVSSFDDEASAVALKLKNLNPNNELKKIFGASVLDRKTRQRNGRRSQMKHLWLINPKDHWPPLVHSGISMKVERKNGTCMFFFEHDQDYQKTQKNFLSAIRTMNADKIAYIVKHHPYHVDALIQLSDIYRASEDLQMAADLNERALYCLEFSFHPCFKMDRMCKLDYRKQQNRALFVSLFKHLTFVGERACYRTALELCKLILNFDFDLDPLAVVLCMDFYALRSRQYAWLISAANEWESRKNLSQLPNFAFSTALAHFYISEADESDLSVADKLLQDALILFPGVLMLLLEKCSVQCDPMVCQHPFFTLHVELDHSPALMRLISLYVHRTYHEWKVPRVVSWLERNVHRVLERLNTGDPWITECMKTRRTKYTSLPRNVLRHLILSDIKEVMSGIGVDSRVAIFTFDPVPPLDSIDIYSNNNNNNNEMQGNISPSQNLTSLFFRSLLPNFDVYNRQAEGAPAENAVAEIGLVLEEAPGSLVADALRYGVSMLIAAVESVVTDLANRVEARLDGGGGGQRDEATSDESDSEEESSNSQDEAQAQAQPQPTTTTFHNAS